MPTTAPRRTNSRRPILRARSSSIRWFSSSVLRWPGSRRPAVGLGPFPLLWRQPNPTGPTARGGAPGRQQLRLDERARPLGVRAPATDRSPRPRCGRPPFPSPRQRRRSACAELVAGLAQRHKLVGQGQLEVVEQAAELVGRQPVNAWKSSCPAEVSPACTDAGAAEQAVLGAQARPPPCAATRARSRRVRDRGRAARGGPEKRLSRRRCSRFSLSARHLGEGDRERVERKGQGLGVEVAARVEALRLAGVGVEVERAVGHGAQLAARLGVADGRARRCAAPCTWGSTRSDTGACGASTSGSARRAARPAGRARAAGRGRPSAARCAPSRAAPSAPTSAAAIAPSRVACSSSERGARRPAAAASAGASGAPLTSARPSLACSS